MSPPPTGTVTFLFTDLEGSTSRWEEEPDAMRTALEFHDKIVRLALEAGGGYVFATGGDGFAAAFSRASDAVAAAVTARDMLASQSWPTRQPLKVRMALHTGEASERDGNYFGPAVNRAARLMAAGHGGQVLVSAATAGVVGTTGLVDLGAHRLRDLGEAQTVYQLGEGRFPALRSLDLAVTNLAVQPTPIIGRQELITEIAGLLGDRPVVTLTGPGGVGKTRLSVEVGAEVLPAFPDGVWVVELAPVGHDELVVPAVAEVLGVVPQTGEPLVTTIASRMAPRRLLLIVDNCEQVLASVARLAARLVGSAPGLRVLATSREPLGVAGEQIRVVPSLAERTEAVELFVDRAQRAGVSLTSPEQLAAATDICQRLDGLPLAIELAAARVRMMEPAQIAERLDRRFRLLTGGGRTVVERHRTLQATVAWSYDLLDDVDQVVFMRLSSMAASFDLEAATAVTAGQGVKDYEALDALGRLVDKSMVMTVRSGGLVRYQLLETLRQFAADRLVEAGQAVRVAERAAQYWRDRARATARRLGGSDHASLLDAIDTDIDNYRAAFAHLLGAGRVEEVASGVLALEAYWQSRRTQEGLAWLQQLLTHEDLEPSRRLRVLAQAGQIAATIGDLVSGERYALEAEALADAIGVDPPWAAPYALIQVAGHHNDLEAVRRWWQQAREVAAGIGNIYVQLLTDCMRFPWGICDDGPASGVRYYETLLAEVRRHGDPMLICAAEGNLLYALHYANKPARAQEVGGQFIVDAESAGAVATTGALVSVSAIYALNREVSEAVPPLARALTTALAEGTTGRVLEGLWVAAALAGQQGRLEEAATLLAGAARHADPLGISGLALYRDCRERAQHAISSAELSLEEARLHGRSLTLDELVALALTCSASPEEPAR